MARYTRANGTLVYCFKQTSAPTVAQGLSIGDTWADTSGTAALKVCTAISPVTFVSIGSAYTLPAASASALGGVNSITSLANNWVSYIDTSGLPHQSQPAFSNLSGNITTSQMNSGTSASSSTYWRGDGTWSAVSGLSVTTKGDLQGYDSAANRIPVGANYSLLNSDSTVTLGVSYNLPFRVGSLSSSTGDKCDFTTSSSPQFGTSTAGSGQSTTTVSNGTVTGLSFGWQKLNPNGNATGEGSVFFPNANAFTLAGGQITIETLVYIPTLSNGTNRYLLTFGLGDTNLSSTVTKQVMMQYTDNVNSGQWVLTARNAGGTTTTNSTTAPSTVTNYRLRIVINAAATLATFYVNDVSIGTVAGNFPTSQLLYCFVDNQSTVGGNLFTWVDYMQYEQQFTTPR